MFFLTLQAQRAWNEIEDQVKRLAEHTRVQRAIHYNRDAKILNTYFQRIVFVMQSSTVCFTKP